MRVVQYVRMSSDMQKLSIENQCAANEKYARMHDMEIIDTYRDEAKSGLRIENRSGIKKLLKDVQERSKNFQAVLVYDVSRWGRFQNTDEAAYHDYHCRLHGAPIIYVAENIPNDGSPINSVWIAFMRGMAGQAVKDLSVKTRAGQARLAQLGFAIGTQAHIGLRRLIIDEHGKPRAIAVHGESKAIHTDRTIIVPGPPKEVAQARRIFRTFADSDIGITALAAQLQSEGLKTLRGELITKHSLAGMLRCEAYAGDNVWGKRKGILGGKYRTFIPRDQWIRKSGCFEAIIKPALFQRVQAKLGRLTPVRRTDAVLLDELRAAIAKGAYVTGETFRSHGLAGRSTYEKHFGTLTKAYELAGYQHDDASGLYRAQITRAASKDIMKQFASMLEGEGASIVFNAKGRNIDVNGCWRVNIVVARQTSKGDEPAWRVWKRGFAGHLTLVVRLNEDRTIKDFFVVPIEMRDTFPPWLCKSNAPEIDAMRFDSVVPLAAFLR